MVKLRAGKIERIANEIPDIVVQGAGSVIFW